MFLDRTKKRILFRLPPQIESPLRSETRSDLHRCCDPFCDLVAFLLSLRPLSTSYIFVLRSHIVHPAFLIVATRIPTSYTVSDLRRSRSRIAPLHRTVASYVASSQASSHSRNPSYHRHLIPFPWRELEGTCPHIIS